MIRTLSILIGILFFIHSYAHDFTYEYEGQTLTYTVIDEEAKTCKIQSRKDRDNPIKGTVIIPAVAKDGETAYTVTAIGREAFSNCFDLNAVVIPASVTSIEDYAFYCCNALNLDKVPDSVISIGSYAFCACQSITTLELPNSITTIGEYAFEGCSSLSKIQLSSSISIIFEGTFCGCWLLESITIPDSVIAIGRDSFFGCIGLKSVEIPASCVSIGYNAFQDCINLSFVNIPDSITELEDGAFFNCYNLKSVNIPRSLMNMGYGVFDRCFGITDVYYNSLDPIGIENNTFYSEVYENATLHVPESAIDTFKETDYWSDFKNIKGYDFADVEEISANIDYNYPYQVYKINGEYIGDNTVGLSPGVYILRQGKNAKKIRLRH